MPVASPARRGFTLVEMSIVLAIIGIIIGGILAGQELYQASQLQSVGTDIEKLKSSFSNFRLKYNGVPGDLDDATRYWGTYSGSCTAPATCSDIDTCTSTLTCNGDGDGKIGSGSTTKYEALRAWQHLSNAGLIWGSYSGIPGPAGYGSGSLGDHLLGVNAPQSRLKKVGYSVYYVGPQATAAGAYYFPGEYGNTLAIGGQISGYETMDSVFTPADAWSLDKKIDDGAPATGNVRSTTTVVKPNCTNGIGTTAATATYQVTNQTLACALYYTRIGE